MRPLPQHTQYKLGGQAQGDIYRYPSSQKGEMGGEAVLKCSWFRSSQGTSIEAGAVLHGSQLFLDPSFQPLVILPFSHIFTEYSSAWLQGFPGDSDGKESACNAGDLGLIPGWEYPLEKRMAIHFSIPAWRISQTEEPGGLQSMVSHRVGYDWVTELSLSLFYKGICPWREGK